MLTTKNGKEFYHKQWSRAIIFPFTPVVTPLGLFVQLPGPVAHPLVTIGCRLPFFSSSSSSNICHIRIWRRRFNSDNHIPTWAWGTTQRVFVCLARNILFNFSPSNDRKEKQKLQTTSSFATWLVRHRLWQQPFLLNYGRRRSSKACKQRTIKNQFRLNQKAMRTKTSMVIDNRAIKARSIRETDNNNNSRHPHPSTQF
jgi:hypothetical protein